MSFIPKPQEIYKHFKGNLYQITAIAEHTETGEQLVIYQALYGDFRTYARPLEMFVSRVDRGKYPDAEQEFRFELQGPDADRQRAESETPEGKAKKQESESSEPEAGEAGSRSESLKAETGEPKPKRADSGVGEKEPEAGAPETDAEVTEPEDASALDPMLVQFLDADSYEERLNILAGLRHRITDDMITTMAIACGVEVEEGELQERCESLKACLLTMQRYECTRLR
ncbi:MAG: DUF1653 domain-containing protein [bacterium]|nr:DUF1653 domain-containing protein [bacterium]